MKKSRQEKGITLIALIITIVVLLILAVVAIRAVQGDGIIQYAKNARETYGQSQTEEEERLLEYEYQMAEAAGTTIGGYENYVLEKKYGIKIGDYVNYTYDAAEDYYLPKEQSGDHESNQEIVQTTGLKWRVLGLNDAGQIELISDTQSNNFYLGKDSGYNNGVYIINDICAKQYSNSALGITARSITIEDIEEKYSNAGKKVIDNYINAFGMKYGETISYGSGYNYYPTVFSEEIGSGITGTIREGGIGVSEAFYESFDDLSLSNANEKFYSSRSNVAAEGNLAIKHLYYKLADASSSYFENETVYDMLFYNNDEEVSKYWVASRTIFCDDTKARFSLRCVNGLNLMCMDLFYSNRSATRGASGLRPIVAIPSSVSIVTNSEPNSATNMWELSKS